MRVLRQLLWGALASLLLVGLAPTTVQAEGSLHRARVAAACPTDGKTRGTNTAPNPPLETYFLGDWRLGPDKLPTTGAIGTMLKGYQREGDTGSVYWFLGCYWQTDPATGTSGWWYPDKNGFALDKNGNPIEKPLTLHVGEKVDLFGSGRGNFLAPAGTPYGKRAIPPSNLDTFDKAYPYSYHLYTVTKDFTVEAGPIRPWFGQPGLGLQYLTADRIPALITAGNLKALN